MKKHKFIFLKLKRFIKNLSPWFFSDSSMLLNYFSKIKIINRLPYMEATRSRWISKFQHCWFVKNCFAKLAWTWWKMIVMLLSWDFWMLWCFSNAMRKLLMIRELSDLCHRVLQLIFIYPVCCSDWLRLLHWVIIIYKVLFCIFYSYMENVYWEKTYQRGLCRYFLR